MRLGHGQGRSIVLVAFVAEVLAAAGALLGGWLAGHPPLATFAWDADAALWGVAATMPLLLGLGLLVRVRSGPIAKLNRLVERDVMPMFGACRVWELGLISLAAGVGEEMLFRGFLQGAASHWLGSVAAGVMIASLLFGLAHYLSSAYALLATLIGVYLGLLWLKTGNLLAPIVTHGCYDFGALVYLTRRQKPRIP